VVIILTNYLDHQVEASGCENDVVDRGQSGKCLGHLGDVAYALNADHCLARKAQTQRVGNGNNLHYARFGQLLNPLPNSGLGKPHDLSNLRIGLPTVMLQLLDDLL